MKPSDETKLAWVRNIPAWLRQAAVLALLAATLWVGRYWYSAEFGLYEDDYTRTPQALSMTLPELGEQVIYSLTHLSDHGKPLHGVFIYTFSYLGGKLGGLQGVYWVGFSLTVLGCWLFYTLLLRLGSPGFALVGGLAYSLYCADTSQAFLTHSLGLQPSLIFLLLAFHGYLSGNKVWSYLLAGLILLNYETPFTVFLAAPLMSAVSNQPGPKETLRQWVRHGAVLALMLAAAALIRWGLGESRVSGLDLRTALLLPTSHMLLGPWFSLKALASKAYLVTRSLKPEMVIAICAALPVYIAALTLAPFQLAVRPWWRVHQRFRSWLGGLGQALRPYWRLALVGLALLVLAYPLTFTIDVNNIDGRDSRVHFAAVVGAAWLVACAGAVGMQLAQAVIHKLLGAALLAAFFSLLLAYGFVIQGDYALAWQQQRTFWTQLLPLVEDASDGTVILVEPSAPRATGQIGVLTWNTPRVLALVFTYPSDWQRAPRVYRLEPGWERTLTGEAGQFHLNGESSFIPESLFLDIESRQVIFIEVRDGELIRRTAPFNLDGNEYPLKPLTQSVRYPAGPLYNWLILP
jgi:hypothetical protein